MDSAVTIDMKGRILIPKEIRDKLNLKPGIKLFIKIEIGRLVLLKNTSVEDFQEEIKSFQHKLKELTTDPIPTEKLF